jgi:hypothetical protein
MDRREAIKRAATLIGGTLLMPDVLKAWTHPSIENPYFRLTPLQDELIAEVSDVIIPTTTTPGAKAAGVPQFIKKMLADCYRPQYSEYFLKELNQLNTDTQTKYSKGFLQASVEERTDMLKTYEQKAKADRQRFRQEAQSWGQSTLPSEKPFFDVMKDLTVTGYFTSEIGCTQALRYEPVPGRYEMIEYKKGDKAWATG